MINNDEIDMLNDIDLNASKAQDVALLLQTLDDNETTDNSELSKRQRKILIESILVWCTEISAFASAMILKNGGTK